MRTLPGAAALAVWGLLSLPALAAGEAPTGVRWFSGSFDEALAAARAEQKLVLLDAWASWCRYCFVMDDEVWSKDEVGRTLAPEVIAVRAEVDGVKGVGLDLRDRYEIEGLPLVLLIDPADGRALERLEGYRQAPAILEAVDRARLAAGGGRKATAAAGEDPSELLRVAGQLRRSGELAGARGAAEKALALDPDCRLDAADDAVLFLADLDERQQRSADALGRLSSMATPCARASGAAEIWTRRTELAGTVEGEAARGRVLLERAAVYPDDPLALRDAALWKLRSGQDTDGAAALAARALALAPDDPRGLAAVAEVDLARGEFARAGEAIDKAIRIDPHDPGLRELRLRITMASRR